MKSTQPRSPHPAVRIAAPVCVLLALLGTWLGHTLEYLRISGPAGLTREMTRSVHLYMVPLGAVLLALAVVGGVVWLRALNMLAGRLEQLRQQLRHELRHPHGQSHRQPHRHPLRHDRTRTSLLRTDGRHTGTVGARPGLAARLGSLWLVLGAAQVGLYLVQENLELGLAGRPAPGLAAVGGHHWAAVPIHLAVALLLAGMAVALFGSRLDLERAVEHHEGLLASLWRRRDGAAPLPTQAPPVLTPHQRWGSSRWQRPPPTAVA